MKSFQTITFRKPLTFSVEKEAFVIFVSVFTMLRKDAIIQLLLSDFVRSSNHDLQRLVKISCRVLGDQTLTMYDTMNGEYNGTARLR